MPVRASTRFVEVDGLRLRVSVRPGDALPVPLLLCNGIGANLELWEPLLDELTDVPTIAFDAPGVGHSSVPWYPPTLRRIAATVTRMLDELDVPVVDVLGISWGGGLAQELTRRSPDRVRRLVLVATLSGWIAVPARPRVLLRLASPKRYWSPAYLERLAGDLYGGEFRDRPQLVRRHGHLRYLHQITARGYAWQVLAGRRWTSVPWLHRIAQPTLVLAGDDDPIIPLVNARFLAGRLPNATLHVARGGGHLFLLTRPAEYAELITRFLADPEPVEPAGSRA